MITRLITLSELQSFFLFGPRGTGKSTLLEARLPRTQHLWVDLLDPEQELHYLRNPNALLETWRRASAEQRARGWLIIDEIQRVPKLLDLVHIGIERMGIKFALTGSSARKLRRGAANLLAGRASTLHLHPFSFLELGEQFDLHDALRFGLLPKSLALRAARDERKRFLASYVNTYLYEEINAEQFIRKFEPFVRFLSIAAEANGMILNISKLARQVYVEPRTAIRYFQLLEDTLIGFFLPSFAHSARKRQTKHPKFYFFDCGIVRAATQTLDDGLSEGSYLFGRCFEHLVILEIIKASDIYDRYYHFSYYRVTSGDGTEAEIDLIASKGMRHLAIEIKSSRAPDITEVRKLKRLAATITGDRVTPYIFCQAECASLIEGVHVLPWQQGIRELFGVGV